MLTIFLFPVPAIAGWIIFFVLILVAFLSLCSLFVLAGAALAAVMVSFSKIAFALIVALICSQHSLLGTTDTVNYALWAAITLTVTFLLCKIPRISRAIKFMSTFLISYAAVEILVFAVMSFVLGLLGESYEISEVRETIIRVLCTLVSAFALAKEIAEEDPVDGVKKENVVWINIQRLIASAIYSVSLTVIYISEANGAWTASGETAWIMLIVFAAAAFMADVILPRTQLIVVVRKIYSELSKGRVDPAERRKNMIDALK